MGKEQHMKDSYEHMNWSDTWTVDDIGADDGADGSIDSWSTHYSGDTSSSLTKHPTPPPKDPVLDEILVPHPNQPDSIAALSG
jgi:hypothetical protein